ncbi:hypothetical protein CFP56_002097 [Quercus suber]|uniref:Uncharacterized protein n=1 Tax=Quercus suber TaxID=58331 RepID=A0AAW0M9Q4_QUESU
MGFDLKTEKFTIPTKSSSAFDYSYCSLRAWLNSLEAVVVYYKIQKTFSLFRYRFEKICFFRSIQELVDAIRSNQNVPRTKSSIPSLLIIVMHILIVVMLSK